MRVRSSLQQIESHFVIRRLFFEITAYPSPKFAVQISTLPQGEGGCFPLFMASILKGGVVFFVALFRDMATR